MFIPHKSLFTILSTLWLFVLVLVPIQARSTIEPTFAIPELPVVLHGESLKQEVAPAVNSDDNDSGFTAKASLYIKRANKNLSEADAIVIIKYVEQASEEYAIDKSLLLAIIRIESRFNKKAVSPDGAKGLTQVIPRYHKDKIVIAQRRFNERLSLFHPGVSIFVGASVLRDCLDSSKSLAGALLRYNGSVSDPTAKYAKTVMSEYAKAKAQTA